MVPKFDPTDEDHVRTIQKMLMLRAERARAHPADFLEFVMKEQITKRPIKCAPHQRIGFDFMLAHNRCVLIWPAGAAKTMSVEALILWMLGNDPTQRGVILSKTQELAMKPLAVVRDYLDTSKELKLVFPNLRPSSTDSWRKDRLVVERPPGIPDASVQAIGINGAIQGSRLSWLLIDDILDGENTNTVEARRKTIDFVLDCISRLDPVGGRVIVNNTAWHPEDLVHFLSDPKKGRFPCLRMTITGDIYITDDVDRIAAGAEPWDHPMLRPKFKSGADYACRIVRPGIDDTKNDVPLFPERFFYLPWEMPDGRRLPPAKTWEEAIERAKIDIENKRRQWRATPGRFNKFMMGIATDDETAACKREWIEKCKEAARREGYFDMVEKCRRGNPCFTGLDLAVSPGEESDDCSFFTYEILPDRRRRILDIEVGKFDGPTIVRKCQEKHEAYDSVIRVENNAAQDFIRQFAIQLNIAMPIKGHMTGRAKAHPEHGIPQGFAEMSNGAWLIPNDRYGNVHPNVQRFIDECLYYVPSKHTGDVLMSWYFAREQAKEWGMFAPDDGTGANAAGQIAASIMSR